MVHLRNIQQQTLDALLRIEELLKQNFEVRTEWTGEDITDVVTKITPQRTPFLEAGSGALLRVTSGPEETSRPRRRKRLSAASRYRL